MTWLERKGEVQMVDADMEEHGDNLDLKPIKKPGFITRTARLKEFSAITPVDASAVRFAAVDIVNDITSSYRLAMTRPWPSRSSAGYSRPSTSTASPSRSTSPAPPEATSWPWSTS
jgi:hypothetical protein